MELVETKKIIAYIAGAYPRYFASVSRQSVERQAIVWNDALADYSVDAVMTGVKSYISVDSSGFPPSPGQIIEHIHFVGNPRDHSGTEAWALVRKAVNVPWDQFEASFATLPRAAQIAVGSPESLKELAQMDTQRFETVAQSNFLRMYDAAKRREAKEQAIPAAVIAARESLLLELQQKREGVKKQELPNKAEEYAPEEKKEDGNENAGPPAGRLAMLRKRLGG